MTPSRPSGLQQVPEDLGEHLVGVEVGAALEPEGMLGVGEPGPLLPMLGPGAAKADPSLPRAKGQVEWIGDIPGPIAQRLEPGVVLVPRLGQPGTCRRVPVCRRRAACLS